MKRLASFWSKLPVRQKGTAIASIPIACLVASLGIFGWLHLKTTETEKQVHHTQKVYWEVDGLLLDLINAETGVRGFVLTQNREFLEPYKGAIADLPKALDRLNELVKNKRTQTQQLEKIKTSVQTIVELLQATVAIKQEGISAEEREQLKKILWEGKAVMDETKEEIATFLDEEENLLETRKQQLKNWRQTTWTLLYGAAAIGLASSAVAVLLFRNLDRSLKEQQMQSRRNLQRFRDTFEQAAVGIAHADLEGRMLRCNQKFCDIIGYPNTELLGKRFTEFTHPEDIDSDWEYFQQLIGGEISTYSLEKRYICQNGRHVWANLTVSLAPNSPAGKYAIAVIEDITQRKQAQEQLNRFFDLSLDILCISGPDGYFKRVNPAVEEILGYSREEYLAVPWIEFIHPDDREKTLAEVEKLASGQPSWKFENRHRCKDRTYRWLSWTAVATRSDSLIYSAARDITERKLAEAAREREREQLQQIIANAPVAIAIFDTQMRYLAYSQQWLKDYQLPEQSLRCRSDRDVFPHQPQRWLDVFQQALQGEITSCNEDTIEYRDGSVGYFRWAIHPWYEQPGKIGGLVIATNKIDELVRAREAALENARLKSQFLANMSHEIRTPMNGVLGMAGLLAKTELQPKQQDFVDAIRTSGQHLLLVINDILDFSKLEAGEMELEGLNFNLDDCLESVINLVATQVEEKGLELGLLVKPEVPRHLRGDPGRLRQVLLNLIANAIKFTSQGSVVVRVQPIEETGLRFEVIDTGIGIPSEAKQKLFQAFSQVDASTTREYGGTGLGLAICQQLVELMGGEIGVESSVGEGSTFWFTAKFDRQPASSALNLPNSLTNLKLLIADPSATVRQSVRYLTDSWGMHLTEVASGQVALEVLREAAAGGMPYNAAIFDCQLLAGNGENLVAVIQREEAIAQTKLILMTPLNQRDCWDELQSLGAASYLTKPVRASRLFDALLSTMVTEIETVLAHRQWRSTPNSPQIAPRQVSNLQILLAEDHPINQEVILNQLSLLGYQADLAINGQEALDSLANKNYDLVFMDCQMPLKDGYATTRELRQREGGNRHTIVIALTAHAMPADREKCLAAGMDDYLSKPVEQEELEAILQCWSTKLAPRRLEPGCTDDINSYPSASRSSTPATPHPLPPSASRSSTPATPHPLPPSATPSATIPRPLDVDRLQAISGGRVEFQQRLLTAFMEKAESDVEQIEGAIAAADLEKIHFHAHRIKGSSANVGAVRIQQISARLETLARDRVLAGCSDLLIAIAEQLEVVNNFIQEYFQNLQ